MDINEILYFGEDAVTDFESKLKILKFSYNWADAVEESERGSEVPKHLEEIAKLMNEEIAEEKRRDTNNDKSRENTILNFGNEPDGNWKEKLEILKFEYSWAKSVEEEDKKTIEEANASIKISYNEKSRRDRRSRSAQKSNNYS
ncbi:uncharacterized protein LOC134234021 [Saccostrea cucullata]|uniref:uncharacterized protein LOC134234021 n=1 Tax=Saccostrea cuccullata TaxID=36930 RepID=UPI002ED2B45B